MDLYICTIVQTERNANRCKTQHHPCRDECILNRNTMGDPRETPEQRDAMVQVFEWCAPTSHRLTQTCSRQVLGGPTSSFAASPPGACWCLWPVPAWQKNPQVTRSFAVTSFHCFTWFHLTSQSVHLMFHFVRLEVWYIASCLSRPLSKISICQAKEASIWPESSGSPSPSPRNLQC